MSRARRFAAPALAALLGACADPAPPPRAQALVWIDTDAPVPRLFDRLRIALLDARGAPVCAVGCARDDAIEPGTPWPPSFGVVPGAVYARVVLYAAGRITGDVPQSSTAIDRVVALRYGPGVLAQRVFLPLDCAGLPPDLTAGTSCGEDGTPSAPVAPAPVAPVAASPGRRGTWRADQVNAARAGEPYAGDPGLFNDEVWIPGGVMLMGDDRAGVSDGVSDGVPEHPVAVAPFFLDAHEYTVARYRAALGRVALPSRALVRTECPDAFADGAPGCFLGPQPQCTPLYQYCCTLTPRVADAEDLPLNCVARDTAAALCAAEGRRLPTEAEWEWAAGSGEAEALYPWGDDEPGCGDLVGLARPPPSDPQRVCTAGHTAWPAPVGTNPRDATHNDPLDRARSFAFDMAGSMAEWVADGFEFYGRGCWAPGTYGTSPRCAVGARGYVVRGGSYNTEFGRDLAVPRRFQYLTADPSRNVTFRCARDNTAR